MVGLGRGSAGVELVDDQTVILIKTASNLQLPPHFFQINEMALFKIQVKLVGIALTEVVLRQCLHCLDGFWSICETFEVLDWLETAFGLLEEFEAIVGQGWGKNALHHLGQLLDRLHNLDSLQSALNILALHNPLAKLDWLVNNIPLNLLHPSPTLLQFPQLQVDTFLQVFEVGRNRKILLEFTVYLGEEVNLYKIQFLDEVLKLTIDLLPIFSVAAFEFTVEELEVGQIEAILLFEVDALHFLIAFDELRLNIDCFSCNCVLLACALPAESSQFFSHLQQIFIKILLSLSFEAACILS